MDIAKLKAAAPYQSRFSRLWERYDEASPGNAEHMRNILELTLDALETAERHIFKAERETLELIAALEAKDAQIAELLEKQRLIDICQGQGLEHRIAAERRAEAAEKRVAELERQAIQPLSIGELINRLEEQTGEPWGEVYLAGINLETGG